MRTLSASIFAMASIFISTTALAHDFWLAPENYRLEPGEGTNVSIMIGHASDNIMWPAKPHRVVSFRSVGPEGIQDHVAAMKEMPVDLKLTIPGLHILSIETNHAFSELNAKKFNSYVEEEGITSIKLDRVLKGKIEEPGTEIYSRRGKALIQVGAPGDKDPNYLTRPLGQTLEIVPDQHPQRLALGEPLTARVFYRGELAQGVTVDLVDIKSDQGLVDKAISGPDGRVTFLRPNDGNWMLHAVWSAPIETARADYETIFSSLSFSLGNGTN